MSFREVKVTVEIITRHTAPYKIDEAEYLEWLGDDSDTTERIYEYLRAGDDLEVIQSVFDGDPDGEIWSSDVERVEPAEENHHD